LSDVSRFEALVRDGSRDALRAAAELYRGPLLDDVAVSEEGWSEWLTTERERLLELALAAMVSLGEQELAAGRAEHALKAGQRAIALNSMREDAHRLTVRALAAAGRKAEALKHYQDLVALLKRELNAEPDAATRSLAAELRSAQPPAVEKIAKPNPDLNQDAERAPNVGRPAMPERRLTAILAADVAGYSRLVGADEEGTLAHWKAHWNAVVEPKITEHHGRIVRVIGDGILVEFVSVVDAVRCAVEVQRGMIQRNADVTPEKQIEFRIGINFGELIVDRGDFWGDGVNIAARLEALAAPGGISVSGRVQEDVQGKLNIAFEDAGEQQLKNIARPVRVYHVRFDGSSESRPALTLPSKPSIAILSFHNLSGDPDQEYFADGIVEDIITALSCFHSLFVIARNSSFAYKGKTVDARQVGRELGVRYVLEGSVRKSGTRVRITGQFIDASTGVHLWADRFDGALEDIFDLQDRITARVVGVIAPRLEQAEIERAKRKPTQSLDAYDYYLRGLASFYQVTWESTREALQLFRRAIDLDPDFASPHAMAVWCMARFKTLGWTTDPAYDVAETERLAQRAVQLDRDDALSLSTAGFALAYVVGDLDRGASLIDRAVALNPNLAVAWHFSGFARAILGEPDVAINHLANAMRLNPLDPLFYALQVGMALAHFCAGRYDEASSWADRALRQPGGQVYHPALRVAAASNALAGRLEEAQKAMTRLRAIDPALRVSNLNDYITLRGPGHFAKYAEGLRKAGLPE
jgi:adenylate cyclase